MDTLNKSLVAVAGIAIICITYIAHSMIYNKSMTLPQHNLTLPRHSVQLMPHPYNQCIKLLIDQVNKENKESNFDQIKSVCFELMDKEE